MISLLDFFSSDELEDYYLNKEDELSGYLYLLENRLDYSGEEESILRKLMRCIHSLKGHFACTRSRELVDFFHNLESCIQACQQLPVFSDQCRRIIVVCLHATLALLREMISEKELPPPRINACIVLSRQLENKLGSLAAEQS